MAQVDLYLDEDTARKLKAVAKASGCLRAACDTQRERVFQDPWADDGPLVCVIARISEVDVNG
ncbi:MAG: hypothetical protein ACT4QB_01710 [Gammaproteobacteria bacterium]